MRISSLGSNDLRIPIHGEEHEVVGVVTRRVIRTPILPPIQRYECSWNNFKRDFTWRRCIKYTAPICCFAGVILSFVVYKINMDINRYLDQDNN